MAMTFPHITPISAYCLLLASLSLIGCSSTQDAASYAAQREDMLQRQPVELRQQAVNGSQVHLEMIRTMQSRALHFASLAHIDAYEKTHGSSSELKRLRADALRATGQLDDAANIYRQILQTEQRAAAWQGLGLIAAQQGNYPQAIQDLRQSNSADPLNGAALSDLGFALLLNGDTEAARIPLIQAAELATDNRKVVSNLALYLLLAGDKDRALATMQKAAFNQATRQAIIERAQSMRVATAGTPHTDANQSHGVQLRLQQLLLSASSSTSSKLD